MKNPLHYQLSEYDCGPTAMLDAISYLFDREEILPEIIRNVMLYCLDCYGSEGIPGKSGTSRAAMMFLSNWLNGFGEIRNLPVSSQYLSGKSVYLGSESLINETSCNRLVPEQYFNQEGETIYALGPFEGREAVILFNGRTKLEPEKTIEYFI